MFLWLRVLDVLSLLTPLTFCWLLLQKEESVKQQHPQWMSSCNKWSTSGRNHSLLCFRGMTRFENALRGFFAERRSWKGLIRSITSGWGRPANEWLDVFFIPVVASEVTQISEMKTCYCKKFSALLFLNFSITANVEGKIFPLGSYHLGVQSKGKPAVSFLGWNSTSGLWQLRFQCDLLTLTRVLHNMWSNFVHSQEVSVCENVKFSSSHTQHRLFEWRLTSSEQIWFTA